MSEIRAHHVFDKAQFEVLFKTHFPLLCQFATQYVGDLAAAQDICQKVFINMWERRTEIDAQRSVRSYLFTAVKNRCLNYIRDHKKYRSQVLDLDCADFDVSATEDHLAGEELGAAIERALNKLPEKCREVFEMSRYRQMKYKEIADELQIAQKTVEAHMSKAIKTLRTELQDYLFFLLIVLGGMG